MLAATIPCDHLSARLPLPSFAEGLLVGQSVYCCLRVHEGLVHPLLLPTPLCPLPAATAPGAPISLLPHATPAYFVATYHGPTAALVAQFAEEGVSLSTSRFVIVWIAVENTHGDHKGLLATYPEELCRASTLYRPSLPQLPELPPQLHQLSPVASTRPTPLLAPDSVHAFRALTVDRSKPLRSVAAEVGGYVDAVARERDRERERLKRERDAGGPPRQPPPPTPAPPMPVQTFYPSPPQPTTAPPKPSPVPSPKQEPDPWASFPMDDYFDLAAPSANIHPNPIPSSTFEDAFTEDDFSFFDRTITPATSPPIPPGWTPAIDTPISPPELTTVLSSAAPSPEFSQTPVTPNVYLEHPHSPANSFEPIPFSDYHRRADGKHANGKFAFTPRQQGWRSRYDEITDPRIAVVRKLTQTRQQKTEQPLWDMDVDVDMDMDDSDDSSSTSTDSDQDIFQRSGYRGIEVDDIPERTTTPPPAYLPPGAALLRTKFQHRALLPLSVPLRPAAPPAAPLQPSLASVPTPVSPAAHAGQEAERLRALAALGQQIAREVIENPVWGRAWRAARGGFCHGKVSARDIKLVMKALENVRDQLIQEGRDPAQLKVGLSMEELFGLDSTPIYPLEEPMLSIAKGDVVLDLKPPSLRFWEKLGLSPKGGTKNFDALVIFDDDALDTRRVWVEAWVEGLKDVYKAKRYGTMSMLKSPMSVDGSPGLIPVRYDATLRKHVANLAASMLPASTKPLVIFLVLPFTIMSLASPVLRQILALCRKHLAGSNVVLQLVPEVHVVRGMEVSAHGGAQMECMAASVYNRILVPVDRARTARTQQHPPGLPYHAAFAQQHAFHPAAPPEVRRLFVNPAFTLSRPPRASVTYVRAAHAPLDVLDRYTLLHVGYALSACGRWVVACCTDQRGEGWDSRVWLAAAGEDGGGADEPKGGDAWAWPDVIRRVWDFAGAFARRANVEWRVVFARLGAMEQREADAWAAFLQENVTMSKEQQQQPMHHYVVCVVPDAPWMFVPGEDRLPLVVPTRMASALTPSVGVTASAASKNLPLPPPPQQQHQAPQQQQTVFTDVSSATYAVFPKTRLPIFVPPSLDDLGLTRSFVPEDPPAAEAEPAPAPSTAPPIIPQASSILIRVPRATSIPTLSSSSSSNTSPYSSLSFTSATMIQTHLLLSAHSASYTQHAQTTMSAAGRVPSDERLLEEVTRGFFDLGVLARVRWGFGGAGGGGGEGRGEGAAEGLPFHLAAVDAMRGALLGGWDGPNAGEV